MNILFVDYVHSVQAKCYLCAFYKYAKVMINVPFYLLKSDDKNSVILNNTTSKDSSSIGKSLHLPNNGISNLRIGSSHKPRTSEKYARYPGFTNVNVTSVVGSKFSPLKGYTNPVYSFDGIK